MSQLPASAPRNAGEAFAHINAVVSPTIDDLKLMVFLEASGLSAYDELARSAPNDEVRGLLEANGREEMAHAHRVAKVIKILTGEDFPPPRAEDNRYVGPVGRPLDRDLLNYLVTAEAAELLRQNGKEELRHGERAKQAAQLLPA
jgi:hypothetical protein